MQLNRINTKAQIQHDKLQMSFPQKLQDILSLSFFFVISDYVFLRKIYALRFCASNNAMILVLNEVSMDY